ncbi:hypothetical protein VNO77_26814 [Canavalia gladiata]|uniref:Uncharacterized protein n=1 Tax=Canavalia gladiata TaxID=3824 RepID=A0AAN9Q6L5_CANGL
MNPRSPRIQKNHLNHVLRPILRHGEPWGGGDPRMIFLKIHQDLHLLLELPNSYLGNGSNEPNTFAWLVGHNFSTVAEVGLVASIATVSLVPKMFDPTPPHCLAENTSLGSPGRTSIGLVTATLDVPTAGSGFDPATASWPAAIASCWAYICSILFFLATRHFLLRLLRCGRGHAHDLVPSNCQCHDIHHCHKGGYVYGAPRVHASSLYAFHRFPLPRIFSLCSTQQSQVLKTRPVFAPRMPSSALACASNTEFPQNRGGE